MAEHIYTYDDPPSERDLVRVCQMLGRNGVVAYPTDINWAYGCKADSVKALDRMHQIKHSHPKEHAFALLCSDLSMAADLANVDGPRYRVLKRVWPGPYTVILPAAKNLPRQIKDKRRVVGIRIPDSVLVKALIEQLGIALVTASLPPLPPHIAQAYRTSDDSYPHPRTGFEVMEAFGHQLDAVLDLSQELPAKESTIIDWSDEEPVVVRVGAGDPTPFMNHL